MTSNATMNNLLRQLKNGTPIQQLRQQHREEAPPEGTEAAAEEAVMPRVRSNAGTGTGTVITSSRQVSMNDRIRNAAMQNRTDAKDVTRIVITKGE